MAELISMTYEQARAEHFKALMDEAKRKMNYWATRVRHSRPNDLNAPAHIKASEYGAEYSYYNDALEALENQPKWISVVDELPKKWRENDAEQTLVNYQIYSPKYGVDIGNYLKPAGRWVIMGLPVDDVTHWMPLPEPPKEEKE